MILLFFISQHHLAAARPVPLYCTFVFRRELRKSRPYFDIVERNLSKFGQHPALLIFGTDDPMLGSEETRIRFEKAFPNHKTVILRGIGHYLQEEAPMKFGHSFQKGNKKAPSYHVEN